MKAPLSNRAKQILSNADTSKELMEYLALKMHGLVIMDNRAPTFEIINDEGRNITVEPSIGKAKATSVTE